MSLPHAVSDGTGLIDGRSGGGPAPVLPGRSEPGDRHRPSYPGDRLPLPRTGIAPADRNDSESAVPERGSLEVVPFRYRLEHHDAGRIVTLALRSGYDRLLAAVAQERRRLSAAGYQGHLRVAKDAFGTTIAVFRLNPRPHAVRRA